MKTTTKVTTIVSAFSIILAGTLSASPPGKGPIGDRSHKPTAQSSTTSSPQHKILKRTGPPGKGMIRSGLATG
jgi:hypothetical protein